MAAAGLAAGIGCVATFVYFSLRARFQVPYIDDWTLLASSTHPSIATLFAPHNEHIMAVPRLLVWLDLWLWGWPGYATYTAAMAARFAIVAVFLASSRRTGSEFMSLTGALLAISFSTYSLQGVVFPSAVNFPLVSALAVVAVASLAKAAVTEERAAWTAASLGAGILAMLCVTNGMAVPAVLALLSLLLGSGRLLTGLCAALAIAGLALRHLLGGAASYGLQASPGAMLEFGLALLAGPTASISPRAAVVVGGGICLLGLRAMWRALQRRHEGILNPVIVGSVAFSLLSTAMIAIGRGQYDLSVAAESRYTEIAMLAWAGILYDNFYPQVSERRVGSLGLSVLSVFVVAVLPAQWFVGEVWVAKADHLRIAGLILATDVWDADWTWRLHPAGRSEIEPGLSLLKMKGSPLTRMPGLPGITSSSGLPACDGNVAASEASGVAGGLRVSGRMAGTASELRILDGDGRVQGLALPSPPVSDPRAGPNEFVWAELDVLAGRIQPAGHWLGLSRAGAGPPYSALLVDSAGSPVCSVPVTCCGKSERQFSRPELVVRGSIAEGRLDSADCTSVTGWIWDPVRPDSPLRVTVSVENGRSVTMTAGEMRQDLLAAGKGNGAHGFRVPTESLQLPPGTQQVFAVNAETGVPLERSPIRIACR